MTESTSEEVLSTETERLAAEQALADLPTPEKIIAFLDQHVIGQDDLKEKLAIAVRNHYKRLYYNQVNSGSGRALQKSNVLELGPSGKT